jgi:putative hydrolase of the HAD superfamily
LYPEVAEALDDLGRDFRLVALTNGNTDLDKAGVAAYFEFAISPADTGTSKPDPRMLEAVCERAGVRSTAVVHVGDEPKTDIQAAHNAGVNSVWVNRDQTAWPEDCMRATAEISSLDHLRGAILEISNQLPSDQEIR